MRLHTDKLTLEDVLAAADNLPGVTVTATEHNSRSHARAFEVRLMGNGGPQNTGVAGASRGNPGATWDEWGAVIAALYDKDWHAVWGRANRPTYSGVNDFDFRTGGRFDNESTAPGTGGGRRLGGRRFWCDARCCWLLLTCVRL